MIAVIAGSRRRSPLTKLSELFREHKPDYVIHGGEPGTDAAVSEAIANVPGSSIREIAAIKDSTFENPTESHSNTIVAIARGLASVNSDDMICFYFVHPADENVRQIAKNCTAAGIDVIRIELEDN